MSTEKQPKPESLLGDLVPEVQVAKDLRVHLLTLRRWRAAGRAPAHTRIGRTIFYRRGRVEEWLRSREQTAAPRRRGTR